MHAIREDNMTYRTGIFGLLGGAAIALAAGFGAGPAMAQDVTLKLHQFLPAQANVPKLVLDVWADKVEADSGGRIKVERYPSMQLGGKPPELMDQAIDGVADIVWTVVGYTPGRFPSTETFEQPFFEYAVPETILRFLQGFGRLIRTRTDRGVVAIFDRRLLTKSYGQSFIGSLPDPTVRRGSITLLPKVAAEWLEQ